MGADAQPSAQSQDGANIHRVHRALRAIPRASARGLRARPHATPAQRLAHGVAGAPENASFP